VLCEAWQIWSLAVMLFFFSHFFLKNKQLNSVEICGSAQNASNNKECNGFKKLMSCNLCTYCMTCFGSEFSLFPIRPVPQ